jgi:hypothetical protein
LLARETHVRSEGEFAGSGVVDFAGCLRREIPSKKARKVIRCAAAHLENRAVTQKQCVVSDPRGVQCARG